MKNYLLVIFGICCFSIFFSANAQEKDILDKHPKSEFGEIPDFSPQLFKGVSNNSKMSNPPPDANWINTFGGDGADYGNDVASDASGNVYVVGTFSGDITIEGTPLTSVGYYDMFLAKFNSSGVLQWVRTGFCGQYENVTGWCLVLDEAGNIYTSGSFNGSTANFPSGGNDNFIIKTGNTDAFVVKYNSSGDVISYFGYGEPATNRIGIKIAADAGGNSYLVATTTGSYSPTAVSKLLKFDSAGTVQWERSTGNSYADVIVKGADLYLGGTIWGGDTFGATVLDPLGTGDPFIAKSDLNGNFVWAVMANQSSENGKWSHGIEISVDNIGNVAIGGYHFGDLIWGNTTLIGSTLSSSGNRNNFVAVFNSNGVFQWAKNTNTIYYSDTFRDLFFDNSGNVYLAGFGNNNAVEAGSLMLNNASDYIVKYNSTGEEQNIFATTFAKNCTSNAFNKIIQTFTNIDGSVYIAQNAADMALQEWSVPCTGNSGTAIVYDMTSDALGNFYVVGNTKFAQAFLNNTTGDFVAKFDKTGNLIWLLPVTGSFFNGPYGPYANRIIALDKNQNVVIHSQFNGTEITVSGQTLYNNEGGYDGFVMKVSKTGVFNWIKQIKSLSGGINFGGIAVDNSNNIIVSGTFSETIDFGSFVLAGEINQDAYIAKYDNNGNFLWAKKLGGSDTEYNAYVSTDGSDNIYVTGEFISRTISVGNVNLNLSANDGNVIFAKFNPDGNCMWAKAYGAAGPAGSVYNCWPNTIKTDNSGNSYIYGWTGKENSYGIFTLTSNFDYNYFILKADNHGDVQWANIIKKKSNDLNFEIDLDPSGNVYVTGKFRDTIYIESNVVTNSGPGDLYLAKYYSYGSLDWVKTVGSTNSNNQLNGISVFNENSIFIGGNFTNNLDFGDLTLHAPTSNGYFGLLGDNLPAFTSGITPNSVQHVFINSNIAALNVEESELSDSMEWKYSTYPTGPFLSFAPKETSASLQVNFALQGTYYVACFSYKSGTSYHSNVVQINVFDQISNEIWPVENQLIVKEQNGEPLFVTENLPPHSREWKYSETSGFGYQPFVPAQTGNYFTPNFAVTGTYYVVCTSTLFSDTTISNEIQVKVVNCFSGGCMYDAEVSAISIINSTSFNNRGIYTSSDTLQLAIHNAGSNELSDFMVYYQVGTSGIISENVNATLLPGQSYVYKFIQTVDLSVPAKYGIKAWVDNALDQLHENDTLSNEFISLPVISSFPYTQDFEGGDGFWIPASINGLNSWQLGAPDSNLVINQAASGTQCYKTNLFGNYFANERSTVTSPVFDFSGMVMPYISLKKISQCYPTMAMGRLQYSPDMGKTWIILGMVGDPENWYNTINNKFNHCWSGFDTAWVQASHHMNVLAGKSNVMLRIQFIAFEENYSEGFAFDDISIYDNPPAFNAGIAGFKVNNLCNPSSGEPISIDIVNQGLNDVYNFQVGFAVDNNEMVFENFTDTIAPFDTVTYTFTHTADLLTYEFTKNYSISGKIIYPSDEFAADDEGVFNITVYGDYVPRLGWKNFTTCNGLLENTVWSMLEDNNGDMWFTHFNNGVSRFDGTNWTYYTTNDGLAVNYSWSSIKDKLGNLWFQGTGKPVITKYDGSQFIQYSIPAVYDECAYCDQDGNLWFGSWFQAGVLKYDGTSWNQYPHGTNLPGSVVVSIGQDTDGAMLFATDVGVFRYDGTSWNEYLVNGISGLYISEIFNDSKGNVWLANETGIYKNDGIAWNFYPDINGFPMNRIEDITEDINGKIYFGGGNLIYVYDGNGWMVINNGLISGDGIYAMQAASDGKVWVGTYKAGASIYSGAPDWTTIPVISTFPYNQDFEAGDGYWQLQNISGISSWQLGIPDSTQQIFPAASGAQCWATNLSGNYFVNEKSAVISPFFDFTNAILPVISFEKFTETNSTRAGAQLQYSLDTGKIWKVIGKFGDQTNWYNYQNLGSMSGVNVALRDAWAGFDTVWTTVSHHLNVLGGKSGVLLRLVFSSRVDNNTKGFAFDNISIYNDPPQNNAGIAGVRLNTACQPGNNEPITIDIVNQGINPVYDFEVGFSVDGGTLFYEPITDTIQSMDTLVYTFITKANLYTQEFRKTYAIQAIINYGSDQFPDDDQMTLNYEVFGNYIDKPGWNTFTTCDGLIENNVWSMLEGNDGNIWFTSFKGISRFDGTNWTNYTKEDGLADNYSWSSVKDLQGNLWFPAATSNFISKYDGSQFINYPTSGRFEECAYCDNNGNLWFGSYSGLGVLKFDGSNWTEYPVPNNFVLSIGQDTDGSMLFGTDIGAYKLVGETLMEYPVNGATDLSISEIFNDSKGNIWFHDYSNIYKYKAGTWTVFSSINEYTNLYIEDIVEDKFGNVWFSGGNLLFKYNGTNWNVITANDGLSIALNGNIFALCAASDGKIWVGSQNNGANNFVNSLATVIFHVDMNYQKNLGTFIPGSDNVFISTNNDGWASMHMMNDSDGDGVYKYTISNLPIGTTIEYKYALNGNTESNYAEVSRIIVTTDVLNVTQDIYNDEIPADVCLASYSSVIDGLNVSFTNTSLGNPTQFLWSFGDNSYSSLPDPLHAYALPGFYDVCLSIYDSASGCLNEYCNILAVIDTSTNLCKANFTYETTGTSVQFTNYSEGNITQMLWDFGDGIYSTDTSPSHIFPNTGFYNVCLTVFNSSANLIDKYCKIVFVIGSDTVSCNASYNYFINGKTVTFNNTSSGNISNYLWDFGDGNFSMEKNPDHTFDSPDFYNICLTVFDSISGCLNNYCNVVLVFDSTVTMCNASFISYTDNKIAYFTSTSVGDITNYFWDFGDGYYAYTQNPTHTYQNPDYYQVKLSVFDDASGCMDEILQYVVIVDSTAFLCKSDFNFYTDNKIAYFTSTSTGEITSYFWDFGDGSYAYTSDPVHTFNQPGIYDVWLSIYDVNSGCMDDKDKMVVVVDTTGNMCNARFTSYNQNRVVTFSNSSTGDADFFFWSFGDGSYEYTADVVHTYATPGYYDVYLSIYNSASGCMDDFSSIVVVTDQTATAICNARFTYYPQNNVISFQSNSIGVYSQIFWDFDDGFNSNQPNPEHTFTNPGYYNVCLTVIDTLNDCFDTRCQMVYVQGETAVEIVKANFSYLPSPDSLKVRFTDLSYGSPDLWYWSFGDNTAASLIQNPEHVYTDSGYFRTCLTVQNATSQNTKCEFVAVGDVGNSVAAYFSYFADSVTSTGHFRDKSLGNIASYLWNFGDGYISTQKNPSHTYQDTGYYAVCLTVNNAAGISSEFCQDIRIGNALANPCLFSCVWPGDANNDLEANHYDIMTIGLNYDLAGPRRENGSIDWYGQFAQNWSTYQMNGVNNKHGDCNGDGIINMADTLAIDQNFAYSHYNTPDVSKDNDWEINCEWIPEGRKASSRKAAAKLSPPQGKEDSQIYALGYEIEVINGQGIIFSGIKVNFGNSWIGTPGENMLTVVKLDSINQQILIGMTRIDHQNISGAGAIAEITFPLLDGYNGNNVTFRVFTTGGIESTGAPLVVGQGFTIDLGVNMDICQGETAALSLAEGFQTYFWSTGATDTNQVVVNTSGLYYVTVTNEGISRVDSILVTVHDLPVVNLDNNYDICAGETQTLDAGAGFSSYLWSNGDTTQTVPVTVANSYSVTVSDQYGCEGSDQTVLSVHALPVVDLGENVEVCTGSSATLDAGAGFITYEWETGEDTQTLVVSIAGTYTVTVSNEFGCFGSDNVQVSLLALPEIDLGDNVDICLGDSYVIDAGSGYESYLWNNDETTQTITVSQTGNYIVTVEGSNGCFNDDSVLVIAHDLPLINLGANFSQPDSALLDAGAGYETYLWSTGETTQTIRIYETGEYWVDVSDGFGCEGSDTIVVTITAITKYLAIGKINIYPNPSRGAFTFELESNVAENIIVEIYNSWGQMVQKREYFKVATIFDQFGYQGGKGVFDLRVIKGNSVKNYKVVIE